MPKVPNEFASARTSAMTRKQVRSIVRVRAEKSTGRYKKKYLGGKKGRWC